MSLIKPRRCTIRCMTPMPPQLFEGFDLGTKEEMAGAKNALEGGFKFRFEREVLRV